LSIKVNSTYNQENLGTKCYLFIIIKEHKEYSKCKEVEAVNTIQPKELEVTIKLLKKRGPMLDDTGYGCVHK
jgi:hypothetical protein